MEKLRQWFSRTPPPRPRTPPPASDYPTPIQWSPHLQLDPGCRSRESAPDYPCSATPDRMPDLSLRKRLVRLPTGDDALLIGDGSASAMPSPDGPRRLSRATHSRLPSASPSVRRNLGRAFDQEGPHSTPGSGAGAPPSLLDPGTPQLDAKHSLRETETAQRQPGRPQASMTPPPLERDRPLRPPRGLERKHSLTPPPRVPLAQGPRDLGAIPASLQAFLEPRALAAADYAALCKVLLAQEDLLAPARIDAFAQALAQRVLGAARPASRGMVLLIEHVLRPLETQLGLAALGALVHGLQSGGARLMTAASRFPRAGGGMGVAQDVLSRHVAASRERLGPARHAVAGCALARARGLGQLRRLDTSPQALGLLLAHDPLRVLWHPDPLLDEADRLRLLDAALRMPPGIRSRAQAEYLRDAMLATTGRHLHAVVLTILLEAAGEHLPAGSLAFRRLGDDVVARMEALAMTGAVAQCLEDVQRAVDAIGSQEEAAIAALRLGRGAVVIDTLEDGRTLAFDEEDVQRVAAARLQARQDAALAAAVTRLVRFHSRFDVAADPAYLRAQAGRLRASQVPGATSEAVVVARAVADALEDQARQLNAPPAPDRP